LSNIDKVPADPNSITIWKAEARYIRALLYFELVKRYGGVPLIGDRVFTIQDDLSIPRNTYEECINYIVSECDAVKGTLTPEPVSDSNWGKFQEELRLHSKVVLCCMLRVRYLMVEALAPMPVSKP
jgi:hypothetical protein